MNKAKLFKNGNSQAVRLPKDYRFKGDEVYVSKVGGAVVLCSKKTAWELFDKGIEGFTDDFMDERNQPKNSDKRKKL